MKGHDVTLHDMYLQLFFAMVSNGDKSCQYQARIALCIRPKASIVTH